MTSFLDEKRAEIDSRLKELKPLYDEYLMLERAKAALEGVDGPRRAPAGRRAGGGRRRGRRGGTTDAVLTHIRQHPGATVREIADALGMKHPNYLYRVLPSLQEQGAVKKQGKGWAAA
jgi:sugar-specific transcriptional regulator TrmB